MESVGILDPWFLQEDEVEAHAFFVTDVRFIFNQFDSLKVQYVVTTRMKKLPFKEHIKNARQAEKAIHESWKKGSQTLFALAIAQKAKKTGKKKSQKKIKKKKTFFKIE